MIEATIGRLAAGEDLSMDEMANTIDAIVAGTCASGEVGIFLTALRAKGETAAEIAGAALALRNHMTPIHTTQAAVLDTCGTGGDASGTFNISTAAAIVVAAAGVPVAKHGNRAITSRTGSADVLAVLGVNVAANVKQVERCLNELGICFCFAPLMHPSMKQVAEVRKQLGFPTIFNLLGPLANPASAPFQVVGVGRSELRPLIAEALQLLKTQRALVVHGEDGLDEVTLAGPTRVTEVTPAGLRNFSWTPSDFGFTPTSLEHLQVSGPEESARIIREVLAAQSGPAREIVVLNAAAALWLAGKATTPAAAAKLANDAIESGASLALLERLVIMSNEALHE